MVTYKNYVVFSPTHNGMDPYDSNLTTQKVTSNVQSVPRQSLHVN
jgi:hypothetical protein